MGLVECCCCEPCRLPYHLLNSLCVASFSSTRTFARAGAGLVHYRSDDVTRISPATFLNSHRRRSPPLPKPQPSLNPQPLESLTEG